MAYRFLFPFLVAFVQGANDEPPNILFVLPDDLGWSDVSWNNFNTKATPFLRNLVTQNKRATELKQSYSTHRCTPSRASLLTGRYAFRFGLGSDPISTANPQGMSLQEKLLPEFLKEAGYDTHAIGKWHLGFCKDSYLPHNRGFDTHYGHYAGSMHYNTHAVSTSYGDYINHFLNGEPVIKENYTYATFDWAQRAQEIFAKDLDKPKFVYLAFNAPHETVLAPSELIKQMNESHADDIPESRLIQMAAVHAIDLAMKDIIADLDKLERETIVIFQSDNGGALMAYPSPTDEPRSCNFPYRGYKDSLFEGGTLSPSFVYSTKREFPSRRIFNTIHIIDWFPTILKWAKYPHAMPRNLDGLDQTTTFDELNPKKVRTKFIYGLVNDWDKLTESWTTQYVVRYGDWKFMNFQRAGAQTYKCSEGWKNSKHEKYLFKWKNQRKTKMAELDEIAHDQVFKPPLSAARTDGFSLFNLAKDPFELNNYGIGAESKKYTKFYMELLNNINSYFAEEMQKGFEFPITGKLSGRVYKSVVQNLSKEEKKEFFTESGRYQEFGQEFRTNMVGYLGTDWCSSSETDDMIFNNMYNKAVASNDTEMEYLINLILWDGYGPNGETRQMAPVSMLQDGFDDSLLQDIWDDDL